MAKTLVIPRASLTQGGYLSKDDFILFSGDTAVAVTSFNTRTGEVVLLEDDVLAALGYAPIGSPRPFLLNAGDTMTGPLTLVGPPSADLHATTRAYVTSLIAGSSSGLVRGQILPSSFGASGSKAVFTGAINISTTTLTLTTSSHDFQVGQGIGIVGAGNLPIMEAGSVNNIHVSKITAIAGAVLTIADPALHTQTTATVKHDDSAALNAALDSFAQVGSVGGSGTLVMEPGFYRANGPIGAFHSIIKFPHEAAIAGMARPACFRILSYNVPVAPGAAYPQEDGGSVIIQSDRIDTTASILASSDPTGDLFSLNYCIVSIEGVIFRTYDNPQISALDLGCQWNVFLRNVSFDTGMAGQSDIPLGGTTPGGAQPTHGTFALRLPRVNSCTQIYTENVTVSNYGVGIIGSELWHTQNTWIQRCGIGVQAYAGQDANYPIVGDLLIVQCPIAIDCSPAKMRFDCHVDFESEGSGWWYTSAHVNDPGNTASGLIRWLNIAAGSGGGAASPINVIGAAGISFQELVGKGATFVNNLVTMTGDLTVGDDLECQDMTSRGAMSVWDGTAQLPVTFGADNSGGTGKRQVLIQNSSTNPALLSTLVSYWDMSEAGPTRSDKTGHNPMGLPATYISNPSVVAGKLGNAAHGGTSQYLASGNAALNFAGPISISGWANLSSVTGYNTVLGKAAGAATVSFILWWRPDTLGWEFRVSANGGTHVVATVSHTPTVNTWYHVAAIYDQTAGQIRLRINDGAIGANTATFAGPIFNSTASGLSTLGIYYDGFIWGDCAVDELCIFNKAFTSGDVTALFAGGAALAYPF